MTKRTNLAKLLAEDRAKVDAMSPEELEAMLKAQRESWGRSEFPRPKYHYENGVKVYESYEDYCND